ncbi:MAG: DUF6058 family natural product biosynthesis protein [Pseudomonadota bacterium]
MTSLLEYLNAHFHTTRQLLAASDIGEEQLCAWQQAGCMPLPSYSLDLHVSCRSFFGQHDGSQRLDFYAKNYVTWLDFLHASSPSLPQHAYATFHQRYSAQTRKLFQQGMQPTVFKAKEGGIDLAALDQHIGREWISFLKGTYGLCTKSGMPEDIADKEMATLVIDEITDRQCLEELTEEARAALVRAMRVLAQASSLFAPHERARSSRQRCIVAAAEKYKLVL